MADSDISQPITLLNKFSGISNLVLNALKPLADKAS